MYMPVSTADSIFFTFPIWSAFFAYVFIKEKITRYDILFTISAFLGVLIINNPFDTEEARKEGGETNVLAGSSFAISGAIGAAAALLCMRVMRDIHWMIPPFWNAGGFTYWSYLVF